MKRALLAFEPLRMVNGNTIEIGFVPAELDTWDYKDPRSGVIHVHLNSENRAHYTHVCDNSKSMCTRDLQRAKSVAIEAVASKQYL